MRRMTEILDEAFDWLGPDIVLAHAKDPPIVTSRRGHDLDTGVSAADRVPRDAPFELLAAEAAGELPESHARDARRRDPEPGLFASLYSISITPISTWLKKSQLLGAVDHARLGRRTKSMPCRVIARLRESCKTSGVTEGSIDVRLRTRWPSVSTSATKATACRSCSSTAWAATSTSRSASIGPPRAFG